jgi:hypothetical protein
MTPDTTVKVRSVFQDDPPNIVVWTEAAGVAASWCVSNGHEIAACDPETGKPLRCYFAADLDSPWLWLDGERKEWRPVEDPATVAHLCEVRKAANILRLEWTSPVVQ